MAERSPYDELAGPFHTAETVTARGIDVGGALRVLTSDGVELYPTFQFDDHGHVYEGVVELLRAFEVLKDDDGWTRASWFGLPAQDLDGLAPRTVVGDPKKWARYEEAALALARTTATRWSETA